MCQCHRWLCSDCTPTEPFEQPTVGCVLATVCAACGKRTPQMNLVPNGIEARTALTPTQTKFLSLANHGDDAVFYKRSEYFTREFIGTMSRRGYSKAEITAWVAAELATFFGDDGDGVARPENKDGSGWR